MSEVLDYAIQMEHDAEAYYKEQAEKFADTPLKVVFEELAKAEAKHARLFKDFAEDKDITLEEDKEQETILSDLPDFGDSMTRIKDQAEVYLHAQKIEKASIELYEKQIKETDDPEEKNVLEFVLAEERRHFQLFDNLAEMTRRPAEWVEDAEFGNRPQY